jgi:lysophospholipase L1-like esterase
MSGKKYTRRKKFLYSIIIILFFLFLIEAIASIADYQRNGKYSLAIIGLFKDAYHTVGQKRVVQKAYHYQQLVRPDSSAAVNKLIKDENGFSDKMIYEPWLQFRHPDRAGTYVNVHGLNRATIPSFAGSSQSADTVTIFFLGGSTMFGFDVADNETIPSCFTKLYQQKFAAGRPIKVLNYGNPFYYSYQELMLLTQLVYTGHVPDIIVVLDGLNDCIQVRSSIQRVPIFTDLLKQFFDAGSSPNSYVDSTIMMYKPPVGEDLATYSNQIFTNLLQNTAFMKNFSSQYSITPFFFIQPVAYYHYPNRENDPAVDKEELPQFGYIYPLLQKKCAETNDFFFLGDMLENEKGYAFADHYHYSPEMNKRIASSILDKINKSIRDFSKTNSAKK